MLRTKDHGRGTAFRETTVLTALLVLGLFMAGCTGQEMTTELKAPAIMVKAPLSPTDMALDKRGNVYVSEMLTGRIYCIAPDGTATLVATRLDTPGALCMDRDGNLLVAETGAGRIIRIAPDGSRTVLLQP